MHTEAAKNKCFKGCDDLITAEWEAVKLTPYNGDSMTYKHFVRVTLKKGAKGTYLYKSSNVL